MRNPNYTIHIQFVCTVLLQDILVVVNFTKCFTEILKFMRSENTQKRGRVLRNIGLTRG